MLQRLGLKEGEAIIHPWVNKALEKAQKVEARNFEIRKNLLKFDDVMNDQRKVVYEAQGVDARRGRGADGFRHAPSRHREHSGMSLRMPMPSSGTCRVCTLKYCEYSI